MGDSNQMDMSPDGNADGHSPATSNSRTASNSGGGSTSHSSYSPGRNADYIPYRPSPRMANQVPLTRQQVQAQKQAQPSPSTTTNNMVDMNTTANFFTPNEDMFTGIYGDTGNLGGGGAPLDNGFMMGGDWDMGGGMNVGTGTGMTPEWNQMLDSINMNWDGMGGAPHGTESTNQ
jgi:hypothetical protein